MSKTNQEAERNLKLLGFICLALRDKATKDHDSLINISMQYGRNFNATKKQIKGILKMRVGDFLIPSLPDNKPEVG